MYRTVVTTDTAPLPKGPYHQAILTADTLYVAGQGPIDPRTGAVVAGSFEEQARLTFANLRAILFAANTTMAEAVKVTVYLADLGNFEKMNEVYRTFFSEPYPARTTVGAQLLSGIAIEVDCIAVRLTQAVGSPAR